MRRLAVVLVVSVLTGCGDSPTAPTSRIPEVAGTYTGPLIVQVPTDSFQGTARFHVAQAGAQLTVTGSISLLGTTEQLATIRGTVNEMWFFIPTAGGAATGVVHGACGRISTTRTHITFTGRRVRWEEDASTALCGTFELSGTLSL